MNKERAVGLEHEQANRLGQSRRQPTGVENFAAGHEQSHRRRTVLSSSDSWADGRATRTVLQWSLVLVHGSVRNGDFAWAAQEELAASFELVVLNRPGFPPNPPEDRVDFVPM
jgi:hypothetical protein